MNVSEKGAFTKILNAVAELYSKRVSPIQLELYWFTLKRFSLADIRRAFAQHIHNPDIGQFMPKPADIVRYLEGNTETQALHAWSKVESAIRKFGSYTSVVFDDPIIPFIIRDMGGWSRLCAIRTEELPFRANEFMTRYKGYVQQRTLSHTHQGKLESSNSSHRVLANDVPALSEDKRYTRVIQSVTDESDNHPISTASSLSSDKSIESKVSDQDDQPI